MMDSTRWSKFSLFEQLAHIGSEIARARVWEEKGDLLTRNRSIERAFELIDLTINDERFQTRLKEVLRLKECLTDIYDGTRVYETSLQGLEEYCDQFALAVRKNYCPQFGS